VPNADIASVQRLRKNEGFGLIELVMAMTMLNIGILAIVAAFNSGAVALARASKTSTATAIADQQMELFRGLKYGNIEQTTSGWNSATADSTWTADPIYSTNMKTPIAPKALIATVTTCPNTNANSCNPEFTTTGPDGRSYRVDTYMYYDQPTTASTTTSGSVTLPASTISVASTTGFMSSGTIYVGGQTVTYTGLTGTSFTGCSGGTGTFASGTTALGGETGEQIKTVAVVVRDANNLGTSLARETSVFDLATGS
jgi:Tfp pilus assembly protein PilV